MIKKVFFITCTLLFWSFQNEAQVIFEESFNGDQLEESSWNYDLGDGCPNLCGWGNNEAQIYTDKNHKVENGILTISANYDGTIYTSTKITTQNKKEFQYGSIEIRAKLPTGEGLWPAFWMLGSNIPQVGWPKCGEIDILEYIGKEPHTIFTSLHTKDSHGNTINTKKTKIETIEEGFHTYGIDWTKDKIDFFVDSILVYTFQPKLKDENTWPYDQSFYFIINLAIGGNFGGPNIDNKIFPQQFSIDYIKVYQ
jgi:beta-glucanase (GH16 family)